MAPRETKSGEHEVGKDSRISCALHAETLARIDANVLEALDWQRKTDLRLNDGDHKMNDYEKRIDRLEKVILGAVSLVLLGVLGMAGTALVWVIQRIGEPAVHAATKIGPVIILSLLCGCASQSRQDDSSQERTVEREVSTITKTGTEGGQAVNVSEKKVVDKEKLTEREARMERETVVPPPVSAGSLMDIVGGLVTGNWGAVIASLGTLLVGKVVGRRGAESEMAEITEGVSAFAKADPVAAEKLTTHLSMAMSKSTKKTVRRLRP